MDMRTKNARFFFERNGHGGVVYFIDQVVAQEESTGQKMEHCSSDLPLGLGWGNPNVLEHIAMMANGNADFPSDMKAFNDKCWTMANAMRLAETQAPTKTFRPNYSGKLT